MGCRLSGLWLDDGLEVNGRDLSHVSQQEVLQILGGYEEPITLQIDSRKSRAQRRQVSDCGTQTERPWDTLRGLGVTVGSSPRLSSYSDRPCCNHMTLSRDHYNANDYLPSIPHDVETMDRLGYKDPELSRYPPEGRGYLIGCCSPNMEEPSSFLSQTEDEDTVLEKPLGYLTPLHELDSGLGCTDGSFHQGEVSGMETEEGAEEPGSSPLELTSRGSPSSESLISSELSDSGFYSVSTGEFRRFQRLLEKKIRLYRAKMAPRSRGDGGDREQLALRDILKARRDLESIPETLTCQPVSGWPEEASPSSVARRCIMGVSSVQYKKAENPCLSRYGSGTSSLLSPKRPALTSSLLSPCRSPSCQQRHKQDSLGDLPRRSSQQLCTRSPETRRARHCSMLEYRTLPALHQHRRLGGDDPITRGGLDCPSGSWQRGTAEQNRGILPGDCCSASEGNRMGGTESGEKPDKVASKGAPARGERRCQTSEIPGSWPKTGKSSVLETGLQESDPPTPRKGVPNPRVLRNQLLKARASRLADERSGVTTDEETRSEAKTGRYWSKTERRRHVLTAREQRQRRMTRVPTWEGGRRKEASSTVLELSHRKLSRLRNRKVLDSWTTIEELLTHGTKTASGSCEILCPSPLLSVTTV